MKALAVVLALLAGLLVLWPGICVAIVDALEVHVDAGPVDAGVVVGHVCDTHDVGPVGAPYWITECKDLVAPVRR